MLADIWRLWDVSEGGDATTDGPQIGEDYKKALSEAGSWGCYMYMQGETIPKETNRVYLSKDKKDSWGIPLLVTDIGYDHNDELLLKDFLEQASETLSNGGVKDIEQFDNHWAPDGIFMKWGAAGWGKIPNPLCSIAGINCTIVKMYLLPTEPV